MYQYEYAHPAVTTDIVVFTIRNNELKLLLIKRAGDPYAGAWALPGGFVEVDESLEEGAQRELLEETGVSGIYLEQLYTFGTPERDPRERVITVAYFALIPSDRLEVRAASDADAVGWFGLGELPPLAFDHGEIVAMAHSRLSAKLDYSTIAFQFMPSIFTLSQLQQVYEIVLGEVLDKRNFRKRVLALQQIEPTGEKAHDGAHRPAALYRVIDRKKVNIIK